VPAHSADWHWLWVQVARFERRQQQSELHRGLSHTRSIKSHHTCGYDVGKEGVTAVQNETIMSQCQLDFYCQADFVRTLQVQHKSESILSPSSNCRV